MPILQSPVHKADWRIGATNGIAHLGKSNGKYVVIVVAKDGPYKDKVIASFIPDNNQLNLIRGNQMKIIDFLKNCGTDQFSILCYSIFLKEDRNHENIKQWESRSRCIKSEKYILENNEWKYDIFLTESYFLYSKNIDLFNVIKDEILNINQLNPIAIICMFDGAFSDFNYLKNIDIIQQTYAFWSKDIGLYIAEDTDTLQSNEWSEKIIYLYNHIDI